MTSSVYDEGGESNGTIDTNVQDKGPTVGVILTWN